MFVLSQLNTSKCAFRLQKANAILYFQALKLLTFYEIVINKYACKFLLVSPNCHSLIFFIEACKCTFCCKILKPKDAVLMKLCGLEVVEHKTHLLQTKWSLVHLLQLLLWFVIILNIGKYFWTHSCWSFSCLIILSLFFYCALLKYKTNTIERMINPR